MLSGQMDISDHGAANKAIFDRILKSEPKNNKKLQVESRVPSTKARVENDQ